MVANIPSTTEFLTVPDLVERFGLSPGKVHRLIEDHYLPAIRIDGILKVPSDFVVGAEPLTALRGTILVLLDAGFRIEEAVSWMFMENDELNETPVAALHAGRKSAVRRATQGLAF